MILMCKEKKDLVPSIGFCQIGDKAQQKNLPGSHFQQTNAVHEGRANEDLYNNKPQNELSS